MYIIREKMFRLAEDSDITYETGQLVRHVDGKSMSLHNRLILRDHAVREVVQGSTMIYATRPSIKITIAI